jgi:hypothetical protein
MKGWKTLLGSLMVAAGTLLVCLPPYFPEQKDVGEALLGLGASLGVVGLGHKLDKVSAVFLGKEP